MKTCLKSDCFLFASRNNKILDFWSPSDRDVDKSKNAQLGVANERRAVVSYSQSAVRPRAYAVLTIVWTLREKLKIAILIENFREAPYDEKLFYNHVFNLDRFFFKSWIKLWLSEILKIRFFNFEVVAVICEYRYLNFWNSRIWSFWAAKFFNNFLNSHTPVARKIADEVVFRRFQGEGVEFSLIGPHWLPLKFLVRISWWTSI